MHKEKAQVQIISATVGVSSGKDYALLQKRLMGKHYPDTLFHEDGRRQPHYCN